MAIIEPEFMELTSDLDLDSFWYDNSLCQEFKKEKARCSLSFSPDDHWLFEFFKVPSTLRYYFDKPYRDQLHKEANQITMQHIGRTFFVEDTWEHSPKRIENLFGCDFTYVEGGTPWLTPVTTDPEEFNKVLDNAAQTDLSTWAFSDLFLREWEHRRVDGKSLPGLGTGSRGPATIMTSILHPELLFFWLYDHPDLMHRFSALLAQKMIELNTLLRTFSGLSTPGWWITDDNCALFNKKLYREYCFPVLEKVLNTLAPGDAYRYQHSDSAMGHLLDMQQELGINSVNYGPTVDAGLIRERMPSAMINGQLPPMLLRNGTPEAIKERIISDFEKAGDGGGLNITTAGSLAAGTGIGRMRWMMKVVQDCCRYGG